MIIKHKFINRPIDLATEILIVGTFNPDTPGNDADFFYSRGRNYLWQLVPAAFGEEGLKGKSQKEKRDFIAAKKIDFVDLISEVDVEDGQEINYDDRYLDKRVTTNGWRNIEEELEKLPNLRKVCFSRKTLTDIPEMKKRIEKIQGYCEKRNIAFHYLKTPARGYSASKQEIWSDFFRNEN